MDELKSECAIFDKFSNEMESYLYMFCSRMLNRIFKDVNGTGIVAINGKMFLTNTIIKKEFLYRQKLGATTTGGNVFSLSSGLGGGILLLTHLGDKITTHIKITLRCTFSIMSMASLVHIRIPS